MINEVIEIGPVKWYPWLSMWASTAYAFAILQCEVKKSVALFSICVIASIVHKLFSLGGK